jgi:DNA-binding GntR family transcriptional regulator
MPRLRRTYQNEHRRIVAALGNCNIEEATAAMKGHLLRCVAGL